MSKKRDKKIVAILATIGLGLSVIVYGIMGFINSNYDTTHHLGIISVVSGVLAVFSIISAVFSIISAASYGGGERVSFICAAVICTLLALLEIFAAVV